MIQSIPHNIVHNAKYTYTHVRIRRLDKNRKQSALVRGPRRAEEDRPSTYCGITPQFRDVTHLVNNDNRADPWI
jgi:hypothetical protein